jgi:hypothetical protein
MEKHMDAILTVRLDKNVKEKAIQKNLPEQEWLFVASGKTKNDIEKPLK